MATTTTKKRAAGSPSYLGDYASGNFTPNYDYVSGYYNQNAGYVNPSVYGYRGNRYNIPTNAGFAIPMKENDPYWNLGAMLGGLWGANYNKRGAEAAGNTAEAMLQEEYARLQGQPTQEQQYAQAKKQADDDARYEMAQRAGINLRPDGSQYNFGDQKGSGPQNPAKVALGTLNKANESVGVLQGLDLKGAQEARRLEAKNDLYSMQAQKYFPNGINGPANENPVGNKKAGDEISNAVNGDISKIDITKLGSMGFDSDLLRANIIARLKKDGRNEWQIAQAMQGIEPVLLNKQREYNNNLYDQLYPQYQALLKAGRAEDAGILLSKMNKLKPENADALNIGYKKELGYALEDEAIDRRISQYMKRFPNATKEEATMYAMNLTGGRNAGKGLLNGSVNRPVGASPTSSTEYVIANDGTPLMKITEKMAETFQKRLDNLYKKENKTKHDMDLIVWLNQAIDSTYSGNPYVRPFGSSAPTKNGGANGDPEKDYGAAMSLATSKFEEEVKRTGSADKALEKVRTVFGSGGMGDKIYNDVKNGELYKAWKGAGSPGDRGQEEKPDIAGYRRYLMDNGISINNLGEISSSHYNSSPEETQRVDEIVSMAKERFHIK